MNIVITNFTLKKPSLDDAEKIFHAYTQDPEVTKYLVWEPHKTIDDSKNWIERCIRVFEEETSYPFFIFTKDTNELVGSI